MKYLNLLKANIRKEYIEMKRYYPNTIAMLLTFYFIFLGMFTGIQVVGDPSTQDANIQYMIVNYIFWFLTMVIVSNMGWEIMSEALRGTLEQLAMSPIGMWKILLTRLIASTVVYFFIILFLLFLSMLTTSQWLNIDVLTLSPIFLLSVVSMYGFGYIIAGIALVFKQVQAFMQILQFLLAILTFVPLSAAPFLVYFPFVKGVDLIRQVMIEGLTLTNIPASDFFILSFNAIFYLLGGLMFFIFCERAAMKKGLLGHY